MEKWFLDNKYKRIYDQLCERAINRIAVGYTEKHHVLPKSLGGTKGDNLVRLTGREHYIAHMCLMRCTVGAAKRKMVYAAGWMMWGRHHDFHISSRMYESMRRAMAQTTSEMNRGRIPTIATHGGYWQRKKGSHLSLETREKMIQAQRCRRQQEPVQVRQQIGDKLRGIVRSKETRQKMSDAQMGNTKRLGKKLEHHG